MCYILLDVCVQNSMSAAKDKNVVKDVFDGDKSKWKRFRALILNQLMKKKVSELVQSPWLEIEEKYRIRSGDSVSAKKRKEERLFELEDGKEVARGIIREHIDYDVLTSVGNSDAMEPYVLWSKLVNLFEANNPGAIRNAKLLLKAITMEPDELVSVFAGRVQNAINTLEGMGETYSNFKKIDTLLKKVQASNKELFEVPITFIDALLNENANYPWDNLSGRKTGSCTTESSK
jgi:hypothetical protein